MDVKNKTIKKGDIIKINLGNGAQKYRVLSVDDKNKIVKLITLYDFTKGVTFVKPDVHSNYNYREYRDSNVDIYLNAKFYESLSPAAKELIISTNAFQDILVFNKKSNKPSFCKLDAGDYAMGIDIVSSKNIGPRKILSFGVADLVKYFEKDIISYKEIREVFFLQEGESGSFWLQDGILDEPNSVISLNMFSCLGVCNIFAKSKPLFSMRPVFYIDFSKINSDLYEII